MMRVHQSELVACDRRRRARAGFAAAGFTVTELLIVSAIIGTLGAIAIPLYFHALDNARIVRAIADITDISIQVSNYRAANDRYPQSLTDIGADQRKDPWGNPYSYLLLRGLAKEPKGTRKDKNLHPLNSDFDLYSMGKDGASAAPLTTKVSKDDIIRANDGAFIGLAEQY